VLSQQSDPHDLLPGTLARPPLTVDGRTRPSSNNYELA